VSATRLDATVLEGRCARLEPLRTEHLDALWRAGSDPELWRWTVSAVSTRDEMRAYIESALADAASGKALPFVTIARESGALAGSTRFGNFEAAHARVEIGWTFVARAWQRTALNTEAKLMMLRHAFDVLGLERVELKTDALNAASRAAIRRLGAVEEGTLRHHMLTASGRWRDSVYYSVLRAEWPGVRDELEAKLAARA
jgi:RimJ/RimL family protein N-acetyltransferase